MRCRDGALIEVFQSDPSKPAFSRHLMLNVQCSLIVKERRVRQHHVDSPSNPFPEEMNSTNFHGIGTREG